MSILLNWNNLISGAISSIVNGVAVFLALRGLGRMLDRDKDNKPKGK